MEQNRKPIYWFLKKIRVIWSRNNIKESFLVNYFYFYDYNEYIYMQLGSMLLVVSLLSNKSYSNTNKHMNRSSFFRSCSSNKSQDKQDQEKKPQVILSETSETNLFMESQLNKFFCQMFMEGLSKVWSEWKQEQGSNDDKQLHTEQIKKENKKLIDKISKLRSSWLDDKIWEKNRKHKKDKEKSFDQKCTEIFDYIWSIWEKKGIERI